MKTHASPSLTLAHAFEQFLAVSSFARRTCESYAEDLAPLLAECGQKPVTALTADIVQAFLVRQESLAPATFNRRLAALRSFTRWLRAQGWEASALLDGIERKPEGQRAARAPCAAWNATSPIIARQPNAKRVSGNVDSV